MKKVTAFAWAFLLTIQLAMSVAGAEESPVSAVALYKKECGNCHGPIGHNTTGVGGLFTPVMMPVFAPNLAGIIGKPAGAVPEYAYSSAFMEVLGGKVWDADLLDAFITDSRAMVPRSFMFYRQPDPAVRAQIIALLKSSQ